jgi:hypothetical protein
MRAATGFPTEMPSAHTTTAHIIDFGNLHSAVINGWYVAASLPWNRPLGSDYVLEDYPSKLRRKLLKRECLI